MILEIATRNEFILLIKSQSLMSQRFINIIRHYKRWKAENPDLCIEHCINQSNQENAIIQAALSVDQNGKKHRHQYRLQRATLIAFADNLINNLDNIANANNFDELIQAVRVSKVHGVGELAVYDAAIRIGAFMNIWPERIYLHAGAKVGAVALINNEIRDIITKEELPEDFRIEDLSCYELEDMLCIYKSIFISVRERELMT